MKKRKNETLEQFEQRRKNKLSSIVYRLESSLNPKKNKNVRRKKLNAALQKPGTIFTPWLFKYLRKFRGKSGPQKKWNQDLFIRSQAARRRGRISNFF